jgi:hypothetical protein
MADSVEATEKFTDPALGDTGLAPQDHDGIAFAVDSVIIDPALPVSMYVKAEGRRRL